MNKEKGVFKKAIYDMSYQHSFFSVKGKPELDVLMCNDMAEKKSTDKDIVKSEDVYSMFDKMMSEFPKADCTYEEYKERIRKWKYNWVLK